MSPDRGVRSNQEHPQGTGDPDTRIKQRRHSQSEESPEEVLWRAAPEPHSGDRGEAVAGVRTGEECWPQSGGAE